MIKNKIEPFDFKLLRVLYEKCLKNVDLVKDKEVYLIFGETGVGKSTTIQYLCGSKMGILKHKTKDGGLMEYIGPLELN